MTDGRLAGRRFHKTLGTTNWETAQLLVRDIELGTNFKKPCSSSDPVTIEQAYSRFLVHLESRRLKASTLRKHRLVQRQLNAFAKRSGISFLSELSLQFLDEFAASLNDAALSLCKKFERLRAAFRFWQDRKWVTENPASRLRSSRIASRPTMPFTREEMAQIIVACDQYLKRSPSSGLANANRMRALILLLRYSGMRISNAISLSTDRINGNRLFLYTQKTGVPVFAILPDFVAEFIGLNAAPERAVLFLVWCWPTGERSSELANETSDALQNGRNARACSSLQRHDGSRAVVGWRSD
jgi:hypothetical protein